MMHATCPLCYKSPVMVFVRCGDKLICRDCRQQVQLSRSESVAEPVATDSSPVTP